jgi:hypothetical protein
MKFLFYGRVVFNESPAEGLRPAPQIDGREDRLSPAVLASGVNHLPTQ